MPKKLILHFFCVGFIYLKKRLPPWLGIFAFLMHDSRFELALIFEDDYIYDSILSLILREDSLPAQ